VSRALPTVRVADDLAVDRRGEFHFVFSGGSTPKPLYAAVAASEGAGFRFDRWHVWFGDERFVPRDHPDSNYAMAEEALLRHVPIPRSHVHRVRTEIGTPEDAAAAYEAELRREFRLDRAGLPRFDLVLLGMGDDGHTGSLFPGSALAHCDHGLVVGGVVEKLNAKRVSLTARAFNASRRLVFLVTGAGKAATLRAVLQGDDDPAALPAQRIRPADGRVVWLLDRAAAADLD